MFVRHEQKKTKKLKLKLYKFIKWYQLKVNMIVDRAVDRMWINLNVFWPPIGFRSAEVKAGGGEKEALMSWECNTCSERDSLNYRLMLSVQKISIFRHVRPSVNSARYIKRPLNLILDVLSQSKCAYGAMHRRKNASIRHQSDHSEWEVIGRKSIAVPCNDFTRGRNSAVDDEFKYAASSSLKFME